MVSIIASIESAMALLRLEEIAKSDGRVNALLFAAEDYCANVGATRTASRKELMFARAAVANAAAAYELAAIDMVCVNYQDDQVLKEECQEGRELGYVGK